MKRTKRSREREKEFITDKTRILNMIYEKYQVLKDSYLKELWNECIKATTYFDLNWYLNKIKLVER